MQNAMKDVSEVLLDEKTIQTKVREIGGQITRDYQDRSPLLVCILKGAFVFCSDLIRNIQIPLSVDFISVASYGSSTRSSGEVQLIKDIDTSIDGRDVLLVEDIVDTGLTLTYLIHQFAARNPASLRIATLLSKPDRRKVGITVDYVGFEIPDKFVVGYGLDFDQKYRNLPYISVYQGALA